MFSPSDHPPTFPTSHLYHPPQTTREQSLESWTLSFLSRIAPSIRTRAGGYNLLKTCSLSINNKLSLQIPTKLKDQNSEQKNLNLKSLWDILSQNGNASTRYPIVKQDSQALSGLFPLPLLRSITPHPIATSPQVDQLATNNWASRHLQSHIFLVTSIMLYLFCNLILLYPTYQDCRRYQD